MYKMWIKQIFIHSVWTEALEFCNCSVPSYYKIFQIYFKSAGALLI